MIDVHAIEITLPEIQTERDKRDVDFFLVSEDGILQIEFDLFSSLTLLIL